MSTLPPAFARLPLAHRALHGAGRPENSRAAVEAAVARGYGIEIDLQPSRDGVAMVFHDETLDRLTEETGPIAARDADTLSAIALRGSDQGVPRLSEILSLVAGRVPVLLELKDQQGALGAGPDHLERAVARDLAGYRGPVAVMSFNPSMVARMAALAPETPRGLVTCGFEAKDWPDVPDTRRAALRAIPDYAATGASFISHHATDLARPRVAELKADGATILCWTIRSPAAEAEARRIAHNITFEGYLPPLPA